MQLRLADAAGGANLCDHLSAAHIVAALDEQLLAMRVGADPPACMLDQYEVAVAAQLVAGISDVSASIAVTGVPRGAAILIPSLWLPSDPAPYPSSRCPRIGHKNVPLLVRGDGGGSVGAVGPGTAGVPYATDAAGGVCPAGGDSASDVAVSDVGGGWTTPGGAGAVDGPSACGGPKDTGGGGGAIIGGDSGGAEADCNGSVMATAGP